VRGAEPGLNDPETKPNQTDLDVCEGMVDDIARKRCTDAAYENRQKDLDKAKAKKQ
jgi:hypothetical protein